MDEVINCPNCGEEFEVEDIEELLPARGSSRTSRVKREHPIASEIRGQIADRDAKQKANRDMAAWLDMHHAGEDPGPVPRSVETYWSGRPEAQRRKWIDSHIGAAHARHDRETGRGQDPEPGPHREKTRAEIREERARRRWGVPEESRLPVLWTVTPYAGFHPFAPLNVLAH